MKLRPPQARSVNRLLLSEAPWMAALIADSFGYFDVPDSVICELMNAGWLPAPAIASLNFIGAIDGVNSTYILQPGVVSINNLMVFKDGLLQEAGAGADYIWDGAVTVTFLSALESDSVLAFFAF